MWPLVVVIKKEHEIERGRQKAKMGRVAHQGDSRVLIDIYQLAPKTFSHIGYKAHIR